jgi:hypothetical protein
MNQSSDRAAQWVQMWLDVSPEESTKPADESRSPANDDFENNGLVIMQRKFMKAYARMSPQQREKYFMQRPAYAKPDA